MIAERVLVITNSHEDVLTAAITSQVTVASDTEAVDSLHGQDVDVLIVTDGLPATDPLELVEEIRREFPSLPIVFIPDSDSGILASDALAAGVDDYIPLSVTTADASRLRSGLDRALRNRSLSDPSDELAALHTATQEMIEADSPEALAECVIHASTGILEFTHAAVHFSDDNTGMLLPAAWTDRLEETIDEPPPLGPDSLAWLAFENNSTKYYADVSTVAGTLNPDTKLRTELFVPLGDHGLLIISSTTQDAFNAHEREIVSILGANATAALNSVEQTSQLRASEQALKRQNKRLEQFATIVSHDLRNPLNVAQGRLELAREECESADLDAVADAHDRMYALIEDLLALARGGKRVDEPEPVDLASLVDGCWRNVSTAEATLVADIEQRIQADGSRLQQLLENLMRNAVEHGGNDVTVTIGELDDGFYFEDDGSGIPQEERDEVFEAGYSTTEDGTGFGLSIAKQVAAAHGWDVCVVDGSDGGTRFEITGIEFTAA